MGWQAFELTSDPYEKLTGQPEPVGHRLAASPPLTWRAILNEDPYTTFLENIEEEEHTQDKDEPLLVIGNDYFNAVQ